MKKKVKLLGTFLKNNLETHSKGFIGQSRPLYNFYILKILSVSNSQYEKDIAELKNICGDKTMSFSLEDEPVGRFIEAINKQYDTPIIKIIQGENIDKIRVTLCVDDMPILNAIEYLSQSGFNVTFDKDKKIVITEWLQSGSGSLQPEDPVKNDGSSLKKNEK